MEWNRNTTEPTWGSAPKDPAGSWIYKAAPIEPPAAGAHTLEDAPRRARWFAGVLERILRDLRAAGTLRTVEVTTGSQGDDAYTADLIEPDSVEELVRFVGSCEDFVALSVMFCPRCVDMSGRVFEVPSGAELVIDVEVDESFVQPRLSRVYPFTIALIVRTTLFTEATFEGSGDNRVWARANRPTLAALLERLEAEPELSFSSCESRFHDQVRRFGFADLSQEYRCCRVDQGAADAAMIERTSDGRKIIAVRQIELNHGALLVDYERLHKGSATTARVVLIEHLVPAVVSRYGADAFNKVSFQDVVAHHELGLAWPPKVSPAPVPGRAPPGV